MTIMKQAPANVADSGRVRLGGRAPSFPPAPKSVKTIADSGKVALGGRAPVLPRPAQKAVADSGKVRLGGRTAVL
jgi:hypothetical protein